MLASPRVGVTVRRVRLGYLDLLHLFAHLVISSTTALAPISCKH
jgi:hypothetical protein